MAKFGAQLGKKVAKVDNHARFHAAKVEIRERVLAEIGTQAVVFDAFAGEGHLFRDVWHRAAGYVGCDLRWFRDERLAYAADNRRVLRSLDLSRFGIFDLDAYGSPWEQALIIAQRRPVQPGERIGLVLTEGSGLKLRQGALPRALQVVAGLDHRVAGAARLQEDIINRAVAGLAARMGCDVARRWQAGSRKGSAVQYIGLVLEGEG